MGGSPVEPRTIYLGLLGGYLFADIPKVIGYDSGSSSGERVEQKIGVPNNRLAGANPRERTVTTNLKAPSITAKVDFEHSIEAKAGVRVTFVLDQNGQGYSTY